jgi:hypothetical protein
MEEVLTNTGDKTSMKLLSKIHIAQVKNSVLIPEKTHSASPWFFLSFKADTRLQLKDSTQCTSLAPQNTEVLGQRDFMPRCAGLQGQRLSHYGFKIQTLIQPNTLLTCPLPPETSYCHLWQKYLIQPRQRSQPRREIR